MMLVIDVCDEKMHSAEFSSPVANMVKKFGDAKIVHYLELKHEDIDNSSGVIICGTALKDDNYLDNLDKFEWLLYYDKKVLGICAGMQLISLVFGGKKIGPELEIGKTEVFFKNTPFNMRESEYVYSLHKTAVSCPPSFKPYGESKKCIQMIGHDKKRIWGVMFHPEVMNEKIIEKFCGM